MKDEQLNILGRLIGSLRAKIDGRLNLQMILKNTVWLFADKIVRLAVGLIVWTWLARYLGPEQFGLFSYTIAFVAIFSVVASLGLNGIVVRDLVKHPNSENATLGAAFIMQLLSGILACGLAVLAIGFIRPDDHLVKIMTAVLGLSLILKSTEVVKYWFESKVQSKYTIWLENGAFLIFSVIKVLMIIGQAPLVAFVWVVFIEGLLVGVCLLWLYGLRGGKLRDWQYHYRRMVTLIRDSWPLMLSGLTVMVYMRIDQIMLGHILGDEAVGVYSAAVRVSEVWYFIPMAVAASVFPAIIEAKKHEPLAYYRYLQRLYDLMVLIAVLVALPVAFGSQWIVHYMFGDEYAGAASVLAIHVWSAVFVFLGVASSNWYLLENMQKQAFYRTALGAIVNVFANLLLIPWMGISGAALGTLLAQVTAAYLFDYFGKNTRRTFWMKTASLFPFIPALRVNRL